MLDWFQACEQLVVFLLIDLSDSIAVELGDSSIDFFDFGRYKIVCLTYHILKSYGSGAVLIDRQVGVFDLLTHTQTQTHWDLILIWFCEKDIFKKSKIPIRSTQLNS